MAEACLAENEWEEQSENLFLQTHEGRDWEKDDLHLE